MFAGVVPSLGCDCPVDSRRIFRRDLFFVAPEWKIITGAGMFHPHGKLPVRIWPKRMCILSMNQTLGPIIGIVAILFRGSDFAGVLLSFRVFVRAFGDDSLPSPVHDRLVK